MRHQVIGKFIFFFFFFFFFRDFNWLCDGFVLIDCFLSVVLLIYGEINLMDLGRARMKR